MTDWRIKAVEYCQNQKGKIRYFKHYRCGQCRARKRLNRELWQYISPPKCKCGSKDWRMDLHRTKEWLNKKGVYDSCDCHGYLYKHRKGSGCWCVHNKNGPDEQDFKDRYGNFYEDQTEST